MKARSFFLFLFFTGFLLSGSTLTAQEKGADPLLPPGGQVRDITATGSLDLLLDSSGHTIFTVNIRLVKDGTSTFRKFEGTFFDGITLPVGDLEPGTYRVFCTSVTGIWPGPHTSLLKGACLPETVTITEGDTASTMLIISSPT